MNDLAAAFAAFERQHPLQTCVVNGQAWEYLVGHTINPTGEAFLLLPGFFGVASTDFLYLLHFAPYFYTLALNYPADCASVAELVTSLVGFMDAHNIATAHLLGGSYSGYMAQAFVRRYPQRVGKLILAQTGAPRAKHIPLALTLVSLCACLPHRILQWFMHQSMRYFLPHPTPAQAFWRTHFQGLIQSFSHRALYHRFCVALDYHRRYRFGPHDLATWPGAILIVEAAHEALFAADDAAVLRQLYPQAQVVALPGDHLQAVDQPTAQMAAILRFLQGST